MLIIVAVIVIIISFPEAFVSRHHPLLVDVALAIHREHTDTLDRLLGSDNCQNDSGNDGDGANDDARDGHPE